MARSIRDGQTLLFSLPDSLLYVLKLAVATPAALKRKAPIVAAAMRAAGVQPK